MVMLFPPAEEIALYETGFGDNDLLNRRETGKRLSELLERVSQPVVIALDGPWGSGKTYFLKRWVGAHGLENDGNATTIYFDAFANDYFDDPLIGLTAALGERLPKEKAGSLGKVREIATNLLRPGLRIALAAAAAGATEIAGPIADAAIMKSSEQAEKAAEAIWKQEVGRQKAMEQFRDALRQLTGAGEDGRLIFVVDELDRCRPDYALSMLEVIKHFFDVPNVHFVLGVNMEALGHIVRARYGAEVKANDYLKRFISLTMELPEYTDQNLNKRTQITYFEKLSGVMGLSQNIQERMKGQLELVLDVREVSLRDIEKLMTRVAVLPHRSEIEDMTGDLPRIIVSLVLMQAILPDLFNKALKGKIAMPEIDDFFGTDLEKEDRSKNMREILRELWTYVVDRTVLEEEDRRRVAGHLLGRGLLPSDDEIIPALRARYFSTFHVVE
jgi:hypothetical protein